MKLSDIEDKNNTLSKITNKEIFDLCTRIQNLAKVSCADFTLTKSSIATHSRVIGELALMMEEEPEKKSVEDMDMYSFLIEHRGMIVKAYCIVITK